MAYALVSVALFLNFATGLGLGITVARFGTGPSPAASVIFLWSLLVTTASSVVGAVVYVLAQPGRTSDVLGGTHAVLVLSAIVAGTSIAFLADLRIAAARRWSLTTLRITVVGLVRIPLLFVVPSVDPALWVFIVAVAPSAYSGLVTLALLPRVDGLQMRLRPRPPELRPIIRLAAFDWGTTLASQAALYALPVLVAVEVEPAANASFFLAWSAATAAVLVPATVAQIVLVEGARRPDERRRAPEAFVLSIGISAALWLAAVVLEPAVVATVGERFESAARLLPTLLAGCIPAAITSVRVSEARLDHDQPVVVALTVVSAASILGLAWTWLPEDGIAGAGRAWLVGNLVGAVLAVATAGRGDRRPVVAS
jgi:hypothetical protein